MPTLVEPEVYFIGSSHTNDKQEESLVEYLSLIGAGDWMSNAETEEEKLMEVGGRICYNSFVPGLNPNVSRVRDDNKEYLQNIIKQKHGRILEHVWCNFLFNNISRVLTHELITHKIGTSQSQESLRYVRLDELRVYMPETFKKYGLTHYFTEKIALMETWQTEMAMLFDVDKQPFDEKKQITSAMRRLSPQGLCTVVMWTANLRAIRHILEQRTTKHAEEEIRVLFDKVGQSMVASYPNLFFDFSRNEDGEWIPKYSKV